MKRHLLGVPFYELRLTEAWQIDDLPFGIEIVSSAPRRIRLRIPEPETVNPRLVAWLAERHAPVLALQEVPQTLEEAYLAAMQRVNEGLL